MSITPRCAPLPNLPAITSPRARRSLLSLAAALLLAAPAAAQFDWMQFAFDSRHSGVSQQETIIHAGNVVTLTALPAISLLSTADGAPAYLAGVSTASGVKDLLFLTTKDGHILALDALTGATIWSKQPATGPRYTTSSPAIDPNRSFVYSYGLEGKVHKYQVGDGTEILTGGWPQTASLKPSVEKGSAALSIATATSGTTYLYVANGGYPGDAGDYQGHVTAINLATGAQHVFNTMCADQTVHFVTGGSPDCAGVQSAVWARAGLIYDSDLDRIFFGTGNGTYNANAGGHHYGDSILELNPDATGSGGSPLDSYTPVEFQSLQNADADLGSTAPAILPPVAGSTVAHLAVQSGKDGQLRLLNLDNLSGALAPNHIGGELQKINVPQLGGVLTQPAVWADPADGQIWVFVANFNGISGLKVTAPGGNPQLATGWSNPGAAGTSPIVVNGILFYFSNSGMLGLTPSTGGLLWSDATPGRSHWESPIVVNGRLYVTDENSKLWIFKPAAEPLNFFTVPPCRVIDTRRPNGTFGGPAIQATNKRNFPLAGNCGVPSDARAAAVNITVVASATGDLRVTPTGVLVGTSNINFAAGQVRANNAVLSLTGNPLGSITVTPDILPGPVQLIVDVSGYFK